MSEHGAIARGCFWCVEAVFQPLRGVERVVSGYIGGRTPNPSYEMVCSGVTGHAEAVQVHFDAPLPSSPGLPGGFFAFHDPTTLNAQGPDQGTQYRSAIFYHTPEQKAQAEQLIQELERSRTFDRPILTPEAGPDT